MAPPWYCHALILLAPNSWILGLSYEVLLVSVLVLVFSESWKRLEIGGCAGLFLLLLPQKSRAFFLNLSFLRSWRPRGLNFWIFFLIRSNVRISWMYRYHFYDLKVHFWWPNKRSKYIISSLNTLYKNQNRRRWFRPIMVKLKNHYFFKFVFSIF